MPLSPADFGTKNKAPAEASLTTSQASAQAPAPEDDLITTPVPEQKASLRRPRGGTEAYPGGLVDQFEANRAAIDALPVFLQPLASLGEATARVLDAGGRVTQETSRLMSMQPPKQGVMQNMSDVATLATAATQPAVVALGLGGEAVARTLGANEDTARWLTGMLGGDIARFAGRHAEGIGQSLEVVGGVGQALNVGRTAYKQGKRMITRAGERIAANPSARMQGRRNVERVAAQIKRLVPGTIARRGEQLGPVIGRIERDFGATGAQIDPNHPLYNRLDTALAEVAQTGEFGGPAGRAFEALRAKMAAHMPVLASELAELKHFLVQPARAVRGVAEPTTAAAAAAKARATATDTLTEMMPRDLARNYQNARMQYLREVGRPRRILSSAYSDRVSPMTLYNQVFNPNDQYTMAAISEVAQNSPALKSKLALGYLENMAAATGDWRDAGAALSVLRNTRGVVENAGILSPKELDNLEYFLRRRSLPQLIESFQALVGTTGGAVKGSAATAGAYVASGKPSHMLAALIASGTLAPMRRLMLVPKGSAPWKRFGGLVLSNITRLANDVSQASQKEQEGEDELRDLLEPALP